MQENQSCSSCCGLHNIKLNKVEKSNWCHQNTQNFLKIDIKESKNIIKFREQGEVFLKNKKIREDIYICPFIGVINLKKPQLTSCLLHPVGSPHPDIAHWEHPQNFSFYGENICQGYDCYSKTHQFFKEVLPIVKKNTTLYNQIIGHHNLWIIIKGISKEYNFHLEHLITIVLEVIKQNSIHVTSFEEVLSLKYFSKEDYFSMLGTILIIPNLNYNPFNIHTKGIALGTQIYQKLNNTFPHAQNKINS